MTLDSETFPTPSTSEPASAQPVGDIATPAEAETSAPLAESILVAQAKEDPEAFGALYERYVDRVYAYVMKRVTNVQDAEDLTARIFFRALSRLHLYEDRGLPFGAWLFRIAHNLVANWHRDQSRRRFLSFDDLRLPGRKRLEPEEVVERAEEHSALWDAIQRLPNERQDLLIYKFSSRLSNLEIGNLMDKSEGAIKSLYFRTLASLRKDLQAQQWGVDKDRGSDESK